MNPDFAVLGPDDSDAVSTTFPSCGIDLASEDSFATANAGCFVCTTGRNANRNRLGAAAAWVLEAERCADGRWSGLTANRLGCGAAGCRFTTAGWLAALVAVVTEQTGMRRRSDATDQEGGCDERSSELTKLEHLVLRNR